MKTNLSFQKLLTILFIAASISFSSNAQELSKQEKDYALKLLKSTREKFLSEIKNLTPEQWNFKADSTRWSIAECAEHITVSEETLFGLVTKIMADSANADKQAEVKIKTDDLVKKIEDRSVKAKAPEMLKPTHRWKTEAELIAQFEADRQKTIDYVKNANSDLHTHLMQQPAFGYLDAYQWLVLLAAHSARHTAQIEEVKTLPGYPKN
ncbi:DinB family protein [Solitalea sp. MAHUQ-68]|uniref:DinB family protein n=1 Tax=Solitalea agri TaxID=2953739 RepID=A0A9X2F460_9SPHI|nr:DinB family protein [Solitalea agri]MCO4293910.1 DinB family protein [Solitalea agri]